MVVLFSRTRRYNTNHFLPYPYLSDFAFTRPALARVRAYRVHIACMRVRIRATAHNHASHARVSASSGVGRVHATPRDYAPTTRELRMPFFVRYGENCGTCRDTCNLSDSRIFISRFFFVSPILFVCLLFLSVREMTVSVIPIEFSIDSL